MGKLLKLRHLYVDRCTLLRYLPKGIGSLKSLQALDWPFKFESDDEALKLGDVGMMDQLQGSLEIAWLGKEDDESEMEKAQLGNKEHLSELKVWFHVARGEQRKGDDEIVKAMQPHENLESLSIGYCHGTTESLYWISTLHNLRKLDLYYWRFFEYLPPLGKLRSLEILEISGMDKVKKVGVEFLGREQEEETLFPKLKRLRFSDMSSWKEWEGITKDSSEMITIMPRLSSLEFVGCPNLKALPDMLYKITALRTLGIYLSPTLQYEYRKGVGKQWHNIAHIPNLYIDK